MDLGTVFECATARDPDAVAIVDGEARRSFAAWHDDIRAIAGGLKGLGLKGGDHLAAVMPNRFEMATLYWACQLSGLIFTPYNWRAAADEIAFVLADAGAKAVAFDDHTAQAVREAADRAGLDHDALITVGEGDLVGCGTPFAALAQAPPMDGPAGTDERETCMMLYTSGTTGRPKGAMLSHRNLMTMSLSYLADIDTISATDSIVHAAPLSHGSGLFGLPHFAKGAN